MWRKQRKVVIPNAVQRKSIQIHAYYGVYLILQKIFKKEKQSALGMNDGAVTPTQPLTPMPWPVVRLMRAFADSKTCRRASFLGNSFCSSRK